MEETEVRFLASLFLVTVLSSPVSAQDGDLRDYQRSVIQVVDFVEDEVRSELTLEERRIQRNISVKVPLDWSFTAQASQGEIRISAGTAWVFQQLAAVQIAEQLQGFQGCSRDYLEYFALNVNENSDRASQGLSVRPVLSPGGFGRRYGGPCDGFQDQSIFHPAMIDAYAAQMNASLTFLYLHELAHHTLGHVQSGNRRLSVSRDQEADADQWAIRVMIEGNLAAPAAAFPLMHFLVLMGGATLEDEKRSTHPLGMRRMRDTMRYAADLHYRNDDDELGDETLDAMEAAERLMPQ